MTVAAMREKLIIHLADAEDNKIKALYTLLADEIEVQEGYTLTDEQLAIVEERRAEYMAGKVKPIDWKEAHEDIRNRRKKKI